MGPMPYVIKEWFQTIDVSSFLLGWLGVGPIPQAQNRLKTTELFMIFAVGMERGGADPLGTQSNENQFFFMILVGTEAGGADPLGLISIENK